MVISCQLSYQTDCGYHRVTCVQVTLVLLNKCKSDDAGNLDEPTRSHKVLPLSEKMKQLHKEKNHMLRLLRWNLLSEIGKKEKNLC